MLMLIPECKRHHSQKCMRLYGVGDGVNTTLYSVWCCRHIVKQNGKYLNQLGMVRLKKIIVETGEVVK